MANQWRHSICDACWEKKNPSRVPHKLVTAVLEPENCCFCGEMHESGIYLREHPTGLWCGGTRGVHAERIEEGPHP